MAQFLHTDENSIYEMILGKRIVLALSALNSNTPTVESMSNMVDVLNTAGLKTQELSKFLLTSTSGDERLRIKA